MTWTLSEFLNLLEVRGQSWCQVELRGSAGFSVPHNSGVVFHALLRGQVRLAGVGGGTAELSPGDVRIILSGEAHTIRAQADSPVQILDFLRSDDHEIDVPRQIVIGTGPVTGRLLSARLKANWPGDLRRLSIPPVVTIDSSTLGPEVSALRVGTLETCSTGHGATALLTRMAQVTLTLGLRDHPACPVLFGTPPVRDPIAHATQLMSADPATRWSVARLASKVGMGRSSFAARFAAEVGRTPMEMLTEARMHMAADLLRRSELKIAEVSDRVGYSSEAAFSRRFARFFGRPPGSMREGSDPTAGATDPQD